MKNNFPHTPTQRHNLRMAFIGAAQQGNVGHARGILERAQPGDINAETLEQALIAAAQESLPYFVRWLMDETALDLKHAGPEVLAQALRERDAAIADMLTAPGVIDLSPDGQDVPDALSLALEGEKPADTALLQMLIARGAKPLGENHDAFAAAVAGNSLPALKVLLDAVGDDAQGILDSRLCRAAGALDLDGVRLLLQAGADAGSHGGEAAKRALSQLEKTPSADRDKGKAAACCLHALLEAGGDPTGEIAQDALVAAMRIKNSPLVHYLLKIGTDPEPRMRGIGYNPLVIAAQHGFCLLLDKLHNRLHPDDRYYHEAMRIAAERGSVKMLDQLIGYGFDPKELPELDLPFAAAVGGHLEMLHELARRGFTTDLTDKTLIEAVVTGNHARMLDYMLDQGASWEAADRAYKKAYNANARSRGEARFNDVLSVITAWEHRSDYIESRQSFGPALDDLRAPITDGAGKPSTGFVILARAGRFGEALARQTPDAGEVLTPADMAATDPHGNSVIEILGAKNQLGALFDDALWCGHRAEMMALLEMVPPVYRGQMDCAGLAARHRHETLQKRALKKPPPRL